MTSSGVANPRSRWKFVHAADLHLDSPMRGLERYDGAPVEALRGATREALANLVEACLREQVALLVIAGDLYDGDWRDYTTGLHFVHEMARLTRAGVRVVVLRGNHDAESQITRSLRMPEGVHVLASDRVDRVPLPELGAVVLGRSYASREERRDLAAEYPDAEPGLFHIGLLHTALAGRPGHEPYAPCSEETLRARGYDYWALGHVHGREVVSRTPWIVFPGNLQGRHIRESGPKGATLVTVSEGEVETVEAMALDAVRWQEVSVPADELEQTEPWLERLRPLLVDGVAEADGRTLAVRVRATGRSALHGAWSARPEALAAQVRGLASELSESIWIEKVKIETASAIDPRLLSTRAREDDAIGGLLRGVGGWRDEPEQLRESLRSELAAFARKLPAELRDAGLDFDDDARLDATLAKAEAQLLPRLLELEGEG